MSEAGAGLGAQDDGGTTLSVGGRAVREPKDPASLGGRIEVLTGRYAELTFLQRLILGGAAVMVVAILVVVAMGGRVKDDYRVLFSGVAERDGAAIIASLQQMNVPYRFTEGGGAIMVPGPGFMRPDSNWLARACPKRARWVSNCWRTRSWGPASSSSRSITSAASKAN